MPVNVAAQLAPATIWVEAEGKPRIVAIAGHGANVSINKIASALNDRSNYLCSVPYRVPVATRTAEVLGHAFRGNFGSLRTAGALRISKYLVGSI